MVVLNQTLGLARYTTASGYDGCVFKAALSKRRAEFCTWAIGGAILDEQAASFDADSQAGSNGNLKENLDEADPAAYASLLKQCGKTKDLLEGRRVHELIRGSEYNQSTFLRNHLVQMYGDCGSLEDAQRVFDSIRRRNVYSWTMIMKAYAQKGHLENARSIFEKMPERDVVSWTGMITAYAQKGQCKEALELFRLMDLEGMQADEVTFVTILDACATRSSLAEGKIIHTCITDTRFQGVVKVGNALVNMYGKCTSVQDAKDTFDRMPCKDFLSWNGMLAAYGQNGHSREALALFGLMDLEGVQPDEVTFITIIDACAGLASLGQAKLIHVNAADSGFLSNIKVGTALINMFGNCGNLEYARRVFSKMPHTNVLSWTSMIVAYAQNGHVDDALQLFTEMGVEGVEQDDIAFKNIICVCSHAGLLEDGWSYLLSMQGDYGLTPMPDNFICMIDLLGRAGQLELAEELISSMPFEPDGVAWLSLLSACRMHGRLDHARRAAEQVFLLDPVNSSPYVLLSNAYVDDNGDVRPKKEHKQKHPSHFLALGATKQVGSRRMKTFRTTWVPSYQRSSNKRDLYWVK